MQNLVPWLGMALRPLALGAESLSHQTMRETPINKSSKFPRLSGNFSIAQKVFLRWMLVLKRKILQVNLLEETLQRVKLQLTEFKKNKVRNLSSICTHSIIQSALLKRTSVTNLYIMVHLFTDFFSVVFLYLSFYGIIYSFIWWIAGFFFFFPLGHFFKPFVILEWLWKMCTLNFNVNLKKKHN